MEPIKLDEKNRKILSELQKNSRASFSQIGKSVKLPKTVVAYRIKKLVDSGLITLFCTIINKSRFNYIYARLFLKFHNFDKKVENSLLSFLNKKPGIHWVSSLNGCYDFCIILLAKNMEELINTYSEIIYKFSKYILDKDLSISTKRYHYPLKYIINEEDEIPKIKSVNPIDVKIDSSDLEIINLIKQSSRLPLLDIAKKAKLSPQTVRTKIRNLIKNNIISGFRIRINHKMLGFHHFHTFLNLSNVDEKKEKEIIDFISSFKSTIHIIKGTGRYDLEFESLLKSHFELYDIIAEIKNKFPENIQHSDISLIYQIHEINTVKYYL